MHTKAQLLLLLLISFFLLTSAEALQASVEEQGEGSYSLTISDFASRSTEKACNYKYDCIKEEVKVRSCVGLRNCSCVEKCEEVLTNQCAKWKEWQESEKFLVQKECWKCASGYYLFSWDCKICGLRETMDCRWRESCEWRVEEVCEPRRSCRWVKREKCGLRFKWWLFWCLMTPWSSDCYYYTCWEDHDLECGEHLVCRQMAKKVCKPRYSCEKSYYPTCWWEGRSCKGFDCLWKVWCLEIKNFRKEWICSHRRRDWCSEWETRQVFRKECVEYKKEKNCARNCIWLKEKCKQVPTAYYHSYAIELEFNGFKQEIKNTTCGRPTSITLSLWLTKGGELIIRDLIGGSFTTLYFSSPPSTASLMTETAEEVPGALDYDDFPFDYPPGELTKEEVEQLVAQLSSLSPSKGWKEMIKGAAEHLLFLLAGPIGAIVAFYKASKGAARGELLKGIGEKIEGFLEGAKDFLGWMWNKIKGFGEWACEKAKQVVSWAKDVARDFISDPLGTLQEWGERVKEGFEFLMSSARRVIDFISAGAKWAWESIGKLVSELPSIVERGIGALVEWAKKAFDKLFSALGEAGKFLSELSREAAEAFANKVREMFEHGKNALEALLEGALAVFETSAEKIASGMSWLVDEFFKFFAANEVIVVKAFECAGIEKETFKSRLKSSASSFYSELGNVWNILKGAVDSIPKIMRRAGTFAKEFFTSTSVSCFIKFADCTIGKYVRNAIGAAMQRLASTGSQLLLKFCGIVSKALNVIPGIGQAIGIILYIVPFLVWRLPAYIRKWRAFIGEKIGKCVSGLCAREEAIDFFSEICCDIGSEYLLLGSDVAGGEIGANVGTELAGKLKKAGWFIDVEVGDVLEEGRFALRNPVEMSRREKRLLFETLNVDGRTLAHIDSIQIRPFILSEEEALGLIYQLDQIDSRTTVEHMRALAERGVLPSAFKREIHLNAEKLKAALDWNGLSDDFPSIARKIRRVPRISSHEASAYSNLVLPHEGAHVISHGAVPLTAKKKLYRLGREFLGSGMELITGDYVTLSHRKELSRAFFTGRNSPFYTRYIKKGSLIASSHIFAQDVNGMPFFILVSEDGAVKGMMNLDEIKAAMLSMVDGKMLCKELGERGIEEASKRLAQVIRLWNGASEKVSRLAIQLSSSDNPMLQATGRELLVFLSKLGEYEEIVTHAMENLRIQSTHWLYRAVGMPFIATLRSIEVESSQQEMDQYWQN